MKISFFIIPLLVLLALLISGCATPQDAPQNPTVAEIGSTAGLVDIYDAKDVDVKPAPTGPQAPPVIPGELKQRGRLSGGVMLEVVTGQTKGCALKITVIESTHKEFEKPALDAVRRWWFTPALKDGKPVNCRIQIPIRFDVQN